MTETQAPQTPTTPQLPPRKNKDFISAFEFWAQDNFTPEIFNTWTAISVVAGALERKVWLEWNPTLRYYPNIFVMLVSPPGQGKTTALNKGFGLLRELHRAKKITFIPSQVTEAMLIELMGRRGTYIYNGTQYNHSSSFYFASEASDSLKEIYGDITTSMTNLYDCPDFWQKATKKDGILTVENACFNLLAGSTFDYLGKLISDSNIMGGFASRITYVVSKEERIRDTMFPVEVGQNVQDAVQLVRNNLGHDLARINEMIGPFRAEPGFAEAWKEWDQKSQRRRMQYSSEKIKSLLIRQGTSMHKLCMILSASESSDRILKIHHLEKAERLLAQTEDMIPRVFREARSKDTGSADGIYNAMLSVFDKGKDLSVKDLSKQLTYLKFDTKKINETIVAYMKSGILEDSGGKVKFIGNPNDHL